MQHHKSQRKGDDHAQLINGHYLGRCTHLQGVVVAQPACTRGKAGQHQKQPAAAGDIRNAGLGAGEEHHAPAHQQHHRRADGGGKGGVDPLDADLRQNRGKGSEHRRPQRVNEPHGKHLLFAPVYAFVRRNTRLLTRSQKRSPETPAGVFSGLPKCKLVFAVRGRPAAFTAFPPSLPRSWWRWRHTPRC